MKSDVLNKEEALAVYRKLILARLSEEKIQEEYFKDEMKTPVHLGIGGEAIPIGVCHSLPAKSKVFGTYRNHSLYLTMTEDTDGFFGELYGKATGPGKGKAGSMHLSAPEKGIMSTSAEVGTTNPDAFGAALANAYRKSNEIVTVFFGDGAVEEGVFWESLNFACFRQLRILFVCEDNDLAIHTATKDRQGFKSILEAVSGFRCHGGSAEGNDVQSVIKSTHQLLKKIVDDPKPAFLHASYYRFLEHVGPKEDFNAGYRKRPDPEEMDRFDPVIRFEKELCQNGCNANELDAIKKEMEAKIARSVAAAQLAPFPAPEELYKDVFK
ncbi:MAG: thiamine pyrophosphate-dependent dehydrogenase E1 component subunit alpha [Deltaproteobacteria bacterium]|nr:thiamine pyrophosphate-dependent dehydrogenase E1 component subunit alpha [Deltaproteobacteria bacterium]